MILFLVGLVINILIWIVIIHAILSWFPNIDRRNPIVVLIRQITDPILNPIRRIIPPEKTGYIDVSPIIAILALQILEVALQKIFISL